MSKPTFDQQPPSYLGHIPRRVKVYVRYGGTAYSFPYTLIEPLQIYAVDMRTFDGYSYTFHINSFLVSIDKDICEKYLQLPPQPNQKLKPAQIDLVQPQYDHNTN